MSLLEGVKPTLNVLGDLLNALSCGLPPTARDALQEPALLLHPRALQRRLMNYVWNSWSAGTDDSSRATKIELMKHAKGVVLDVGAGHGSLAAYCGEACTAYVALEPNAHMHPALRAAAAKAGFEESRFLLIPTGLEDVQGIKSALLSSGLSKTGQVDTAVCILSLCSVPGPAKALPSFIDAVIKSGGSLLWYEHVRNTRPAIATWQDWISPIWGTLLDQCRVGQDTEAIIRATKWSSIETWGKEGEPADSLFIHSVGVAVK